MAGKNTATVIVNGEEKGTIDIPDDGRLAGMPAPSVKLVKKVTGVFEASWADENDVPDIGKQIKIVETAEVVSITEKEDKDGYREFTVTYKIAE